jgi:predicted metal-binding membrane protein
VVSGRRALPATLCGFALLGWGAFIFGAEGASLPGICAASPLADRPAAWLDLAMALGLPAKLALCWALMIAAMMPPLVLEPLRHLRDRSLARRRGRATTLFAVGYAAVWMTAGAALQTLALACRLAAPDAWAPLLAGFAAAVLWQVSPAKQICLNACHRRPPLAAFGWAAERDALLFGITHALWCVGACWALMLLPLLVGQGHLLVMAGVGVFLLGERLERPATPAWRSRGPRKALRIVAAQLRIRLDAAGLPARVAARASEPA